MPLVIVAACSCLVLAFFLQRKLDRMCEAAAEEHLAFLPGSPTQACYIRRGRYSMYLPSVTAMRVLSVGNTNLAADMVWVKSAHYVSKEFSDRTEAKKFEWLDKLYRTMIELDPYWGDAARLGGVILSAVAPRKSDLAVKLLLDAYNDNPDDWRFPYEIAGIYLVRPGFAGEATKFFRLAMRHDSAPKEIIMNIIPRLEYEAGRYRVAAAEAMKMAEAQKGTPLGTVAARRVLEYTARFYMEELAAAVDTYFRKTGSPLRRPEALVSAGILKRLPEEPFGRSWLLSTDGELIVSEGLLMLEACHFAIYASQVARKFRQEHGRYPENPGELRAAADKMIRNYRLSYDFRPYFPEGPGELFDLAGRRYDYDPESGTVRLPDNYTFDEVYRILE